MFSTGLWKIRAKFHSNPQQSFSAEFEVKEYVLPSFEVKLNPTSSFFYVDDPELTVDIKATYLFGQEVNGVAYVVFGVINDGHKKSFPSSLQRVQIEEGVGAVTLKREHITTTFPNIEDLVKKSIFVAVSVLTENGGEIVEAELRNIQIVKSPYTIHFKKTPKYFKPEMTFDVAVEVVNPDNTPAQGVNVVVEPGRVTGTTADNGMARLTINTGGNRQRLTITAKTNDPRILSTRQASATMTALPYITQSNNYIHIGVDSADVQLGNNLRINLNLNQREIHNNEITYLIMSRGQLVQKGRHNTRGQALISLMVLITKDMLPSFRIIAYYHTNGNEVVSDSVWVDVKDSCMGSVWDIVETYDTGCTPGGGRDGMNVFYDAGLLFESNTASGTAYRKELKCPAPSRRKRATTFMDVRTSLLSNYTEKLQRDCCLDGMRDTLLSYTCERRVEYIIDGEACAAAFLHCCKDMENQRADSKVESLQLARSEEDDDIYTDSNEIVSRTKFPESWLCETTSMTKSVPLQDSITTWQFTGISLSTTHGICVGDSLEVIVQKKFFIDLRLPYSAVRGEQLEVKAILHNYSDDPATVRVDLIEEDNVCSSASKRGKYRQEVRIGAQTTLSVPFIIIPMKEGEFRIEVKAAVKGSSLNDGIRKKLRVVPEGVLVKDPKIVFLDPTNKGVDGVQVVIINSGIAKKDLVPNTPTITQISVTGREQVSALLENAVSGNSVGTLIQQPFGCGEQNMIRMTLPLIAATYLDKTNQWEAVGFEKRNEALQHIKTGYITELKFRNSDGSFDVFSDRPSNSWLTAYVAKVFAMASNLVAVDRAHICEAIKFLILNAQKPDGLFGEVGKSLSGSIDKAVAYLESCLPNLTNPYAVAITSYAMANENKMNRKILYKFASPELNHWPTPKEGVVTLEATAYALLALVKAEAFEDAKPVVRWFNKQRFVGGGYGSTQTTIMVYQAISEYWSSAKEPEYDLNVDILVPGRAKPEKYNFNRDNHYATRTSKINEINQNVIVTARGSGEATVTLVSLYYALPKQKESDCQKFDLSVQLIPEKIDEIYKLRIEVLYKDKERDATMSILDIGLLTGFTPNTKDLDSLSKGHGRTIQKYEMNKVLSDRGSLILYLDKVSHTRPEEIIFRVHQTMKVGVLQPAAVSVYEYYEQTHCVQFYHPERKGGQLLRLCRGDECTCAEENCSMQKKEKISNDQRIAKACESTPTSKIDFVYKMKLEVFEDALSTDIYTMRVLAVIKEGTFDVVTLNNLRTFLSYPHCRESLDLVKGKTYLIMGTSDDIHRDEAHRTYQYVLGERTWIEYWPTEAECQAGEHRPTCLGMEKLVQQYHDFGCLH
ncbi:hypothetical protein JOQ06_020487 [Pogonophryne albipinna]|uniref:Uncharacterized protein n=1 Tax=Pogonophryne albipinna TaxID=1090488 RepID=A0AAD6BS85_9TELE|nr:hypothetical protein JOQ06_020487 [Pogonophryne albipinna]